MANKSPPIRACIFDVDGLLINSEDIYTDIYNQVLGSYNRPTKLPWEIKALQQSRGTKGTQRVLDWANLSIPIQEWNTKCAALYSRFETCAALPGVLGLLDTLSHHTDPSIKIALASSSSRRLFGVKTSRLPEIAEAFPDHVRVFGDDSDMGDAKKKPMPDIFLLALERINASLGEGERSVKAEECLVFEDSIAGVEAGRRAFMRVVWVPHEGLAKVCQGREMVVLEGRTEVDGVAMDLFKEVGEVGSGERRLKTTDGWAQMLRSLEDFPYDEYGICVARENLEEAGDGLDV
ncbi:HAD-like protein [Venturia nashicola]|nr:HAD-like protein [Venturia nashicola]